MRSEILSTVDIPLTQGLFARIDALDAPLVAAYKWQAVKCSGKVYARRQSGGKNIYMHRQIMGLSAGRKIVVDHVNGDTLNNTRSNLNATSQGANIQNSRNSRIKASIHRGVFKQSNGWVSKIRFNNKTIYLGFYQSEELAAAAYDGAAIALYGMKAFLNFGVKDATSNG